MSPYLRRLLFRCCVFTLLFSLVGCATTTTPMAILSYKAPQSNGEVLLVALRGIGGSAKSFERHNFISDLHRYHPTVDVIVPDAHFGYYKNRVLEQRLEEDIFKPALAQGYKSIWLVGVSLGGLGSLINLRYDNEAFDGVVLIAPYSGNKKLHQSIEQYLSGLSGPPWEKEEYTDTDDKDLVLLWKWILENEAVFKEGNIWLGFGDRDTLSGHELLASRLPKDRVIRVEGGHRIKVFSAIWKQILETKGLQIGGQQPPYRPALPRSTVPASHLKADRIP